MTAGISEAILEQLSELIADKMGLSFPRERWHDLELRIGEVARKSGFNKSESYISQILASSLSRKQIELLASHLTIGETYLFRDNKCFTALENDILPGLIKSRIISGEKRLRIWSAGCCTGEEPYSIAILLNKLLPDLSDWNIYILATDINPDFLRKGTQAKYSEWSFRSAPRWVKERNFSGKRNGYYELNSGIKKLVVFSYLNLAEDDYPSLWNNTNAMDIILCRNVLMYFTPERTRKTIQKFHHSLLNGGWLIVSPTEISHTLYTQFATVDFSGATFYKKDIYKQEYQQPVLEPDTYQPDMTEVSSSLAQPIDIFVDTHAEIISTSISPLPVNPLPEVIETDQDISVNQPAPYDEAMALYQQGSYIEAIEKLNSLASSDRNIEVITLLTRINANLGKLDEALGWCEKAIIVNKLDPGLHYLKAIILQEQGAIEDASASLKRALYIDPEFIMAHFAMGNLSRGRRNLPEANRHFNNALSLTAKYNREAILPHSDGITAGSLMVIMQSIIDTEKQYGK